MTLLFIKGIWNIAKGKFKQSCAQLMENDSQFADGKEEELIGRIQKNAILKKSKPDDSMKQDCCGCRS